MDAVRASAARIVNTQGRSPLVLICEHASSAPPPGMDGSLWPQSLLCSHRGFDLGAAELTEALAHRLDAPAILAGITRLYYDINRAPGDPDSAPSSVDGVVVPANNGLRELDRALRFESAAAPFHLTVDSIVRGRGRAAIVSIHSCTPHLSGVARPWHVGVIYARPSALVTCLLRGFSRQAELVVGDNQPYSGQEVEGYTLWRHGAQAGRVAAALEFRNDVIASEMDRSMWVERTAGLLEGYAALAA